MTQHLLDSIDRHSHVLFYPSACAYSDVFQDVPFDAVILNSKGIGRRERKGKVYCLDYDNNELLGLFLAKGVQISAIVIIRDGCQEGGNYQCVARDSFFGRLMPVVAQQFQYSRDHGLPLDVPARFEQCQAPGYLEPFIRLSSPINLVESFHVTLCPEVEKEIILGKMRVTIIRDSIWRDLAQSDLVAVKKYGSSIQAVENYVDGLGLLEKDMVKRLEFVTERRAISIGSLLEKANRWKVPRLSLMPIARGSYRTIIQEIERWRNDYPKEIRFFHLNADDYCDFRAL